MDIEKNFKLIEIAPEPTISPGKNGMFDQSGAMATWIYKNNSGEKFMYYIGWNLAKTTPFRNSIGLAKSSGNNDKYEKISDGVGNSFTKKDQFLYLKEKIKFVGYVLKDRQAV